MPHQQMIADVAFELDPATGYLAYSQIVLIGPRQATGKTETALPVMTHRCTGFGDELAAWVRDNLGHTVVKPGPQAVLYTAQTADDARKKWRDVHLTRLKASSYGRPRPQFTPRLTTNKEALFWRNGSTWSPASTTGKTGGTGDTIDLGWIDEAWSRLDNRTELGLRPAMLTRPWRQLWITSMIPGLSRAAPGTWKYLADKRSTGRSMVEAGVRSGVAFFDFTAATDADPDDPETWFTCMPGLGRTVSLRAVQEDHDTMCKENPVDFQAEYLGWEPKETVPKWGLIPRTAWEDRMDVGSTILGDAALGLEVSDDRQRGWVAAAGRRPDGAWHGEVVEPGFKIKEGTPGIEWMVRRTVDICHAQEICAIVVDPRRPAFALVQPLRNALAEAGLDVPILTPNQAEMGAACGRFYDAAGGVRTAEELAALGRDGDAPGETIALWHLGQRELDRSLAQARKFDVGIGAFVFVKRGQSSEVGPLYAVVEAMHGHEVLGRGELVDVEESMDMGGVCAMCGRSTYALGSGDDRRLVHAVDDSPECS